MTGTEHFIQRLSELKTGDLAVLRLSQGKQLDHAGPGFDLFTGLWWPLRQESRGAPRRETAWLVAKLFGAFPLPNAQDEPQRPAELARVLRSCEPHDDFDGPRFRRRVDALLQAPLPNLEPHLRWALSVVANGHIGGRTLGLDWNRLLDHLSIWDRADEHRLGRDIHEIWAEQYLALTGDSP